MPIVNVKIMYGMMKPEPPLMPAQNGNFQMEPRPMAEPAPAKMKPILDPQVVAVVAILFGLFVVLIEGGSRLSIASRP